MDDKLLTEKDLCEWLQVVRSTVWKWRQDGLPYIKVGKAVRFDKKEVLKWLKENGKK